MVLTLQKLYLLDKHPGKILREAKIPLEKEWESKGDDGYAEQLKARLRGQSVETKDQKATQEIAQIFTTLTAQAKATITLDFNGKGQFVRLAPGQYYLFAQAQPRDSFAVWLLPVTVKSGSNELILDRRNALFVHPQ